MFRAIRAVSSISTKASSPLPLGRSLATTGKAGRRAVSLEERAALRAARKERATQLMQQQKQHGQGATKEGSSAAASTTTGSSGTARSLVWMRYGWYGVVFIPTGLLVWALNDSESPPAQFSRWIGLTAFIRSYTDEISKPANERLLPDWTDLPNVPHDIPVPHTLVLDLENTLVSSSWDRKFGWRHAKRPGVDKFLHDLAQYYEIVLYSPSIDGIADPVVTNLDRDGCIMHRLYRDSTHYYNGVHVKDLNRLNRNVKRMVVIDDDPLECQFNPENLIRVKPYTDPTDRTDNTLERITPFLIEIAREGYSDIPTLLAQYRGMDADEIADEQDRRLQRLRQQRENMASRGLGAFAGNTRNASLPPPELAPTTASYGASQRPAQLTAKDIAGSAAPLSSETQDGLMGFLNRRAKEKEENQMRKIEKWNEVLMKKQKERQERENAAMAGR